jgi:hypothetical protein
VVGVRALTVVVVKDAGSRSAEVPRAQPGVDARRSDEPFCIKALEIEYTVNEGVGGVLAKRASRGEVHLLPSQKGQRRNGQAWVNSALS